MTKGMKRIALLLPGGRVCGNYLPREHHEEGQDLIQRWRGWGHLRRTWRRRCGIRCHRSLTFFKLPHSYRLKIRSEFVNTLSLIVDSVGDGEQCKAERKTTQIPPSSLPSSGFHHYPPQVSILLFASTINMFSPEPRLQFQRRWRYKERQGKSESRLGAAKGEIHKVFFSFWGQEIYSFPCLGINWSWKSCSGKNESIPRFPLAGIALSGVTQLARRGQSGWRPTKKHMRTVWSSPASCTRWPWTQWPPRSRLASVHLVDSSCPDLAHLGK